MEISAIGRGRQEIANVACPEELPLSWMVLRCACQLTDYKIVDVIRTPATRPVFAKRAACLDQPFALLIRKVCIFRRTRGSLILHAHTHTSNSHAGRTCLAIIVPVSVDCGKVDLTQGGH